jgi:hypothetical protein
MTYYLFRLLTEDHAIEADFACPDDVAAVRAAKNLTADFESVEVWDGNRRLAHLRKGRRESAPANSNDAGRLGVRLRT